MSNNNKQCDSSCVVSVFERNKYFYGKLMTSQDFTLEQQYVNNKRRLINSHVIGWGVVCGLDVQSIGDLTNKVKITRGLAIDCCGREIMVHEDVEVELPSDSNDIQIILEYCEEETEPALIQPVACEEDRPEFNRIREHYKITAKSVSNGDTIEPVKKICSFMMTNQKITEAIGQKTTNQVLCEHLKQGCPQYEKCPDIVLADITFKEEPLNGGDGTVTKIHIDPCSQRKLVYSNQTLFDLIHCLYTNYISTWLVLGPIFNVEHQQHSDTYPKAGEIILDIDGLDNQNNPFKPKKITSSLQHAPIHGDTVCYKSSLLGIEEGYTWQTRNFVGIDWKNIHDIEDNIHSHLPGDFTDPFNPINPHNFAGKHHVLAFFLTYINSPDKRTANLCVRSDDSIRVWLNSKEIIDLKYAGEKNIEDYYNETCAEIDLEEGDNILMVAVAEAHDEWGFSARIENDRGLRFATMNPQRTVSSTSTCNNEQ